MAVMVVMVRAISATDPNAGVEGSPLSYTVGSCFFGAVVLCLCGITLAIGGLRQGNRRREAAIAGLIGNLLLPIGVVLISISSSAYSQHTHAPSSWASSPAEQQDQASPDDPRAENQRAFEIGRTVGRLTGFALLAITIVCLVALQMRKPAAPPDMSPGTPAMVASPRHPLAGNRVTPPPLPNTPRSVPPLPTMGAPLRDAAAVCGSCKTAAPEPGYAAKLCAPCRQELAHTPVPQWIMIMSGLIIAAVIASLMWCGPSLNAAIAMERGRRADLAGDYAQAADQYRLAADLYPDAVLPIARLGLALYHGGHDDQAAEEFRLLAGKKGDADFVHEVNMAISDIAARRLARVKP